jgi:hypothetical protein
VLWWTSSSGEIELQIPRRSVKLICQSGQNDAAVEDLRLRPMMRDQLFKIDSQVLGKVLKEQGDWDTEELADRVENERRVLWIAAWDIFENPESA